MTRKIPESFIHELLSRTSLHNVISQHVQLNLSVATLKGYVHFIVKKPPPSQLMKPNSFIIALVAASGNAITFLMEYERLDFFVTANEKIS